MQKGGKKEAKRGKKGARRWQKGGKKEAKRGQKGGVGGAVNDLKNL